MQRSGVPAVRRFGVEQRSGPTYRRDAAFRSDASGSCRVDLLFLDKLLICLLFLRLDQLAANAVTLQCRQVVDEQLALEMIHFMLNTNSLKSF